MDGRPDGQMEKGTPMSHTAKASATKMRDSIPVTYIPFPKFTPRN